MILIFDMDGVVYRGDTPIPGAIEALNELQAAGHRIFFVTNNSTRRRVDYVGKLARMGFRITTEEQVVTSAYATGLYLKSQGAEGSTVFVVGEAGLCAEMEAVGLRVVTLDDPTPADYVVAGLDRDFTYAKLLRAFHEVKVNGARFVATNRDATFPMEAGEIPGGGAIVAPIEYASGVQAITIGKPEAGAWLQILRVCNVPASQALMVGDRPETDIAGARQLGMHTALVLTGVTSAAQVRELPEEARPEFVMANLSELPGLVARLEKETASA